MLCKFCCQNVYFFAEEPFPLCVLQVTPAQQVAALQTAEWKTLFEQNNLLHGWHLLPTGPQPAPKAMYEFDPSVINYLVKDNASVEATLCKSLQTAQATASGFTSASGSVGTGGWFVSAGASYGSSSRHTEGHSDAAAATQKVTEWLFPRVVLYPHDSLRLSAPFRKALEGALGLHDKKMSAAEKAERLMEVFQDYGDYYPESVQLGGKYFMMEDASSERQTLSHSASRKVSAGVHVGFGPYFSASANTSHGSASSGSRYVRTLPVGYCR